MHGRNPKGAKQFTLKKSFTMETAANIVIEYAIWAKKWILSIKN